MSLAEKALFHKNNKIVLLITSKTFYFKKSTRTDGVVNYNAIKETH